MRKPLGAIVLVLVALSAIPVLAQKSGWASDSDPTVKYIVESERKWAESNCAEQPDLKNIIADDFQGTAPSGKRFGKAEAIATDATALDHALQRARRVAGPWLVRIRTPVQADSGPRQLAGRRRHDERGLRVSGTDRR